MPAKKQSTKKPEEFTQTAKGIFEDLRKKTGADSKKFEEWQQKWLAMPATKRKYKHWTDAPSIATQELLAMTNDIVDFVQGQEGSKSTLFQKIKAHAAKLKKDPKKYLNEQYEKAKPGLQKAANVAQSTAQKGFEAAKKTKTGQQAMKKADAIKKTVMPENARKKKKK